MCQLRITENVQELVPQWRECRVAQNGDPIERLLFYALLARGTEREREREREREGVDVGSG